MPIRQRSRSPARLPTKSCAGSPQLRDRPGSGAVLAWRAAVSATSRRSLCRSGQRGAGGVQLRQAAEDSAVKRSVGSQARDPKTVVVFAVEVLMFVTPFSGCRFIRHGQSDRPGLPGAPRCRPSGPAGGRTSGNLEGKPAPGARSDCYRSRHTRSAPLVALDVNGGMRYYGAG